MINFSKLKIFMIHSEDLSELLVINNPFEKNIYIKIGVLGNIHIGK